MPSESLAFALGDFNRDGKLDLAVVSNGLTVVLGNGDGTFGTPTNYPYAIGNTIVVGDFNGDGNLDLAAPADNEATIDIFLGNGDGTFQSPVTSATTETPQFIAAADLNGDHKLDLIIIDTPYISVLLGKGDGTFRSPIDNESFVGPQNLAIGDFNNDHKLDVGVVGFFGGQANIGVLLGNGNGTLQPSINYPLTSTPTTLAVGDFNGDGNLDAAVENADCCATVLLGNGEGSFESATLYTTTSGFGQIAVGDFNKDGVLDLALAGLEPAGLNVLTGAGDGTFEATQFYPAGSIVQYLAVADLNGDHLPDVVLMDRDLGAYTLLNTGINSLSPTVPLVFPPQALHTSATQSVSLTNKGNTSMSIASVATSGYFRSTNKCGNSVAPGETCEIDVTFRPLNLGATAGLLTIRDKASSKPQIVELSGNGTALLLSPASLKFPNQKVGTKSSARSITVTNETTSSVLFSSIDVTGNAAKDFSEKNTCGSELIANSSCTISVVFTPTKAGTRNASLDVNLKSGTNPQPIALSGVGTN
jgi:hypothetical protein